MILYVILKNNSWFLPSFYPFNQNLSVRRLGNEMFLLPLTSLVVSFFSIYFAKKKFNNAKIVVSWGGSIGGWVKVDEKRAEMKQKHLWKAFYCFLSHKMGFSSSIKSKSSEKNNIFLGSVAPWLQAWFLMYTILFFNHNLCVFFTSLYGSYTMSPISIIFRSLSKSKKE